MNKYNQIPISLILESLSLTEEGIVVWGNRPQRHFSTESAYKRFRTLFLGKEFGYITESNGGRRYRAGSINFNGKNRRLLYHVAVWVLHNGAYPCGVIDHKDGNGLNNNIENLRDATRVQNSRNARMRSDNTSGVNGVTWYKRTGKWRAQGFESIDGKVVTTWLGEFDNLDSAKEARLMWEDKLGNFSQRHGIKEI